MKKWIHKDVEDKKVSVIIPVYNVEKYLRKCVDSVISQNHRNLQIILIDDGSTDGSSAICDYYAKQDNRIQVIHKENGGLSSARNAGLDISNGDYILFVDSDDWLPDGAIRREVQVISGENVKLLFFKYGYSVDGNTYPKFWPIWRNVVRMNQAGLLHCYYFPEKIMLGATAWNKMYHADIWKKRRFQEGILFEDDNIMLSLLLDIDMAAFLNEFGYVQYKRPGSITQSGFRHEQMILIGNVYDDLKRIEDRFGEKSVYYIYTQIKLWRRALGILEDIRDYVEKKKTEKISPEVLEDARECVQTAQKTELLLQKGYIPGECNRQYEECQKMKAELVSYFNE